MNFDEFTGEVQNRLGLADTGEALAASRAVLQTLGKRLQAGEATNLAGPLPREIDRLLTSVDHGQRFDFDEFVDRVERRAGSLVDDDGGGADAAYYGQAVVALLDEIIPGGELREVRDSLPADDGWDQLFALVDAEEKPWEESGQAAEGETERGAEGGPAS